MKPKYSTRGNFYRTNWQIRAPQVRVLDETGKQIDVLPIEKARELASQKGLDLVEIAAKANPPVVKIINFAKFKYLKKKKKKSETGKIQKGGELKEVYMTPFIGKEDFNTKIKRGKKFLDSGNKVKVGIKFKGRQNVHKEFGFDLLERFAQNLEEISQKDGEIKKAGSMIFMTLSPVKKKKTNEKQENQKQENEK